MYHIAIISSSIRPGRNSHRVALFFEKYLAEHNLASTEILDLREYNFPIFENPLKNHEKPAANVLDFAQKIKAADGIIIITPEYNGGVPASLKNAIDVLYEEWRHKPVAIATVSAGPFAGTQALVSLQFILWKMKVWTITEQFCVPSVQTNYDEMGNATDKAATDKLTEPFIKELLWCIEADKN
jgi:NAD(P)H-dependent FMN reductase